MKYAEKVIELLSSRPGHDFRMMEILRHVGAPDHERHRARKGVSRVIVLLSDCGSIAVRPHRASRGGFALYRWKSETFAC